MPVSKGQLFNTHYTISNMKTKTKLEILASIAFVCLVVNLPELDLSTTARHIGINSRIGMYLALLLLCLVGFWLTSVSKIIAGYVYIIVVYIFYTQMRFIALFQNPGPDPVATGQTNTQPDKLALSAGDLALAEDFLIKQTSADPNRTDLEKQVITDIIKQYFLKSNKLTELRDFNDLVLKANPIGGPQEITGLAAGVQ